MRPVQRNLRSLRLWGESKSGTWSSHSSIASATRPNNLRPLPSKNIDTGMGLERTAAVMQGVDTNYHIDILRPMVEAAGEVCGVSYDPASEHGRRLRRIADHVRACTFAIHENVYPGPNKEKYVVKRLLRRAVLDGHQIDMHKPFLHQLVPKVVELMRHPYPELRETAKRVAQVIEKEESNFFSTIDAGLERIDRVFRAMAKSGRVMVTGDEAADMYTTHGFPPELFETMAAEHNLTFRLGRIPRGHGAARRRIRRRPEDRALQVQSARRPEKNHARHRVPAATKRANAAARVVGIIAHGQAVRPGRRSGACRPIAVVLDQTPFYGESGGQVGDTGELVGDGVRFEVIDTQREDGFILHVGHLRSGSLRQGATVTARVDSRAATGIRRAHSATHMLHYALQKHLGPHAQQQGSKVDRDWLRFDFANPRPCRAMICTRSRPR